MEETFYVVAPKGFEIGEGKVFLLPKSLYGLKQWHYCFNQKLVAWLKTQPTTHTSGC